MTAPNYPSDHGVVTFGERTSTDRQDRFNDWTREFYLDGEKAGTVTQVSHRLFGLDRHEPAFYRVNFLTGHNRVLRACRHTGYFHVDDYDGIGFLARKAANLFVRETLSTIK